MSKNPYIENLNKLLDTELFINNVDFLAYVALITKNQLEPQNGYTEKHHIIPRAVYKFKKIKIDNTKLNIVKLSYVEHIIAHYFLCKCIKLSQLKYKFAKGLLLLLDAKDVSINDYDTILSCIDNIKPQLIADRRLENSLAMKEKWQNDKFRSDRLSWWTDEHRAAVGKRVCQHRLENPLEHAKPVLCIETNKRFNSVKEAEAFYNIDPHVSLCCKNYKRTCGGYHWAYEDDTEQIAKLSQFKFANKKIFSRKVKCLELNKTFNNAEEAAKTLRLNAAHIRECCRGLLKTHGRLHWEYLYD